MGVNSSADFSKSSAVDSRCRLGNERRVNRDRGKISRQILRKYADLEKVLIAVLSGHISSVYYECPFIDIHYLAI